MWACEVTHPTKAASRAQKGIADVPQRAIGMTMAYEEEHDYEEYQEHERSVRTFPIGVTVTGADDETAAHSLIRLALDFDFVEIGVLHSREEEGKPCYPSEKWRRRLERAARDNKVRLSAHLRGSFAADYMLGKLPSNFSGVPAYSYSRIQIDDCDLRGIVSMKVEQRHEAIIQSAMSPDMVAHAISSRPMDRLSILHRVSASAKMPRPQDVPRGVRMGLSLKIDKASLTRTLMDIPEGISWIEIGDDRVGFRGTFDTSRVRGILDDIKRHYAEASKRQNR